MISDKVTILTACDAPRGLPHEKDYQIAAIRLAKSLRQNGGEYRSSPIVCVHDRPLDQWAENLLRKYDVDVRHAPLPNPGYPNSTMLAAATQPFDTEYGLLVDSDVLFLREPSEFFDGSDVRAAPTTFAGNRWATDADTTNWGKIIDVVGLTGKIDEARRLKTHIDQQEGRFYVSAGAVLFRRDSGIPQLWARISGQIFSSLDRLPPECSWVPTEVGITLAILASSQLSFSPLPERLHLVYAVRRRAWDDTVLVHYQGNEVKEASDLWEV